MKQIKIYDTTLAKPKSTLSFKEKLEIARKLERLSVDAVELPEIGKKKSDPLLVRTISSFVKNAVISVAATSSLKSIDLAADAISSADHGRIRVELPMSAAIMEYSLHVKQDKMPAHITKMISYAKEKCDDVEFCAYDATRAEKAFLKEAIKAAEDAGATLVTLCDSAAVLFPDDFADFVAEFSEDVSIPVGVSVNDKNSFSVAASALCVKKGASFVKTAVAGEAAPLREFVAMLDRLKENYDVSCALRATEINRVVDQIEWISSPNHTDRAYQTSEKVEDIQLGLELNDTKETVIDAVKNLGYDLSAEDEEKVYAEFRRIARKKKVSAKELDAIVASTALQVPSAYTLESYVINSGNIITASAQIRLLKEGRSISGICGGDGPIDASFKALEQIIGRHFELDDFRIQTVTKENEAVGSALVRLRSNGKIYSGTGVSTDIIGASIRAYVNAVNKIVYEED